MPPARSPLQEQGAEIREVRQLQAAGTEGICSALPLPPAKPLLSKWSAGADRADPLTPAPSRHRKSGD